MRGARRRREHVFRARAPLRRRSAHGRAPHARHGAVAVFRGSPPSRACRADARERAQVQLLSAATLYDEAQRAILNEGEIGEPIP